MSTAGGAAASWWHRPFERACRATILVLIGIAVLLNVAVMFATDLDHQADLAWLEAATTPQGTLVYLYIYTTMPGRIIGIMNTPWKPPPSGCDPPYEPAPFEDTK